MIGDDRQILQGINKKVKEHVTEVTRYSPKTDIYKLQQQTSNNIDIKQKEQENTSRTTYNLTM